MLAPLTLLTGFFAAYVQRASGIVTNINNITDYGSCDGQCSALVTKNKACGWEGDLNDAMGLACICNNDHIDSMSTCIDCMDKISSGANVSVFLVTLERVVESCELVNRPVNTPTLITPHTAQPTNSSSVQTSGSASITPSATAGPSSSSGSSGAPSPTTGSTDNGTTQPPNGAVGISVAHGITAGILCVAILALCDVLYL